MKFKISFFIIALFSLNVLYAQVNGNQERKMAIYVPDDPNATNYIADVSSMKQIAAVTGLPYQMTSNLEECLSYGLILFSSPIVDNTFTIAQIASLTNYVENGGCLIFGGLNDPDLFDLAGIESLTEKNTRKYMSFTSPEDSKELRWIDDPYEREIKLGATTYDIIFPTYGYNVSDGEIMGEFRTGKASLVKSKRGEGLVYSLGFAWRDVVIRNLLNRDYNATRVYEGLFDVTSDVIMLLVRGMFTEAIPNSVWISPAPYESKSVLMITHDICSHTAHIFSNDFAQMELERGISATYNITTHKFIDDFNGDNYTSHLPQMQLLLLKNHVVGSHSYGHFPDFDNPEVFPVGEKISNLTEYKAHYSTEENRTIGGTVYGELGISKTLLENDLNTDIKMHRSGHLAVNPAQYNVLDDLGFKYSSSYTARNLLSSFPFFSHVDREMNGPEIPVIEIPITSSDVFGSYTGLPMDEFNWMDKAEHWVEVTEKYANNNAPATLLVHPNRSYKLDALEYALDNMSQDIYPMELTKYADFWTEKNNLKFSSLISGNVLKIYADDSFLSNSKYSFVIDYPSNVERVEFYNDNNELQEFYQKEYYLGTSIFYQKSMNEVQKKTSSFNHSNPILEQNYPNPFSYYTTIEYTSPENAHVKLEVFDIYGRMVKSLINENKLAGVYKIEVAANSFSRGVYFYRIHIQSDDKYTSLTKKMIIK